MTPAVAAGLYANTLASLDIVYIYNRYTYRHRYREIRPSLTHALL